MNKTKSRIVRFPEETAILLEGEYSQDMFKILKGHVELYTGYKTKQEVLLGVIGPQAVFGEFGLLLHKPAIYTAVAFSEVFALRIAEAEMEDFVRENHKNIMDIMRNMANSMLIMQAQINMLSEEIETGKQPDINLLRQANRNIRGYAVYGSNSVTHDRLAGNSYLDHKI